MKQDLANSAMKQDLANVRRHLATPIYTYESIHQTNSSNKTFSPDSNQQITDFFVHVSKEESLRALDINRIGRDQSHWKRGSDKWRSGKRDCWRRTNNFVLKNQHPHNHGHNETQTKPKKKKSTRILSTDDRVVGSAAKQKGVSTQIEQCWPACIKEEHTQRQSARCRFQEE